MKLIAHLICLCLAFQLTAQDQSTPSSRAKRLYKTLNSVNASERAFDMLLNNPKRGGDKVSTRKIKRRLQTSEITVDGFKVLTVQNSSALHKHIILLHGGAYVAEGMKGHRILMEKLALDYNFKVSYIDYPLAPEHVAVFTHAVVWKAYKKLCDKYPEDEFYLFGDSAGGGLALAFLQTLRDRKAQKIPAKTVLQSPWLDISMSNPEIQNYIEKDVLLDFEGLKDCGKLYAGDLDLKDPVVSPIYGNLEELNNIMVLVSTHELFYPDCIFLQQKIASVPGTTIKLYAKNEMIHDWIILPIDERDEAIHEIAQFLLEEN